MPDDSLRLYTRREVLQLAGALTLYIQGCSHAPSEQASADSTAADFLTQFGPVNRTLGSDEPKQFFGDVFTRPHEALWNVAGYLKKNPAPSQPEASVPVVIVGGGLAGLTTAYALSDLQPFVLEQAARLGGNSQGQAWRGIGYSIGAAYFLEPEKKSALANLLQELGVLDESFSDPGDSTAFVNGKRVDRFFARQERFLTLMQKYRDRPALYPNIPAADKIQRNWLNEFDTRSLSEHLTREMGGKLSWELEQWIEHYCWSSFGASAREVSAAAGVNFLVPEFGPIRFFPEGNAGVSERLARKLLTRLGPERILTEALVLQVVKRDYGWDVVFADRTQKTRRLRADSVVLACPKFVAGKIVPQMEPKRLQQIQSVRYRAYAVANVLLDGKITLQARDTFRLDQATQGLPIDAQARQTGATDVVLATYQTGAKDTVLTLYQAFPYDQGRAELFAASSWNALYEKFSKQVREQILPALGVQSERVRGIRIARWGHPMPVPHVGSYRQQVVDALHQPFGGSLFFVHQDNWLLPCLEVAMGEALRWAPEVRKAVSSLAHRISK